jgi:hypothetical protein
VSTNTAVGASALAANSSGIQTVAVGANAAQYQTNNNNTAVGYNSLVGVSGSSNGGSNTAVGSNSLAGLTSGNFNTAIGQQALVANTTASNNTAVGYQAGYTNTTGGANTFIGRLSGYNNTTASENTAIGNSALYWNSTGTNNVAIGTSALSTGAGSAGSHGDFNVAVGVSALNLNRGGNSTAVGYSALGNNSTGTDNTAVGRQTLQANTTGYSNTALGIYALYSNTTAINNTAVGREAGYTNTTGTGGVFVGRGAGYSSNASYSTYLGDTAGYSTTGTSNTFVGNGSGYAVTSGTKNTILGMYNGNQSYLGDIRTLSNHIVLSDGDGVTGFWINAAGRPFLPGLGSDAGTNAVRFNTGTGRLSYDTSSARYKDNIRDSIYGLSHVMQMRSTQFEYKEGGRSDVGLIAEELQPIVPELVGVNKEGQADSVSYDRMVSVLVKAIQELKAEFDAYKATHP